MEYSSIREDPPTLLLLLVHQQLFSFIKDSLAKMQSGVILGFSTETSLLIATNQWILNIGKKVLLLDLGRLLTPFHRNFSKNAGSLWHQRHCVKVVDSCQGFCKVPL